MYSLHLEIKNQENRPSSFIEIFFNSKNYYFRRTISWKFIFSTLQMHKTMKITYQKLMNRNASTH